MLTTDQPSGAMAEETLYHEVCGGGPVALLIPGTPGDASQFSVLAAALSSCYTVVTYDRRGTSRSAPPPGWSTTSVAEQADDAAGLLMRVTSEPALVYGTSNGAAVALELALRHPHRVRAVMFHELPLLSVLADPEPVARMLGELIGTAMERGGPTAALDAFLRFAYGDQLVDQLDPELREQMYANAEMIFTIEMPGFQTYRPDEAALRSLGLPVRVLVGEDQAVPMFGEVAAWLAERVGTAVVRSPGGHGARIFLTLLSWLYSSPPRTRAADHSSSDLLLRPEVEDASLDLFDALPNATQACRRANDLQTTRFRQGAAGSGNGRQGAARINLNALVSCRLLPLPAVGCRSLHDRGG